MSDAIGDIRHRAPWSTGTVVVGAGQAGLAISYHLTQAGHPHVVFERNRIGASWATARWDSFALTTPNWMIRLPGFSPDRIDPDAFLERDAIVSYLETYATSFGAPISTGIAVRNLSRDEQGFIIDTTAGPLRACNAVICTGFFHEPRLPDGAGRLDASICQLHSGQYRNPDALPPGGVLVVGSGQSGAQIAEELLAAGRKTVLSVGSAVREPRRYRGQDINHWVNLMGGFHTPLPDPSDPRERYRANPHCSGASGGHALNLEAFACDGMRLVGRLTAARGVSVAFAPNLVTNVRRADAASKMLMRRIDRFIAARGIAAPTPDRWNSDDGDRGTSPVLTETTQLDLQSEGIGTVIWASGFRCNFDWIGLPVFDARGYPRQVRGVTSEPGLYFCGQHWLDTLKSGLLFGVGEDASHVVGHLLARADGARREGVIQR